VESRLRNLEYVFNPRSIAFVGATEGAAKWGFIILNNLVTGGYEGKLYPVNPHRKTVLGIQAFPSVRDIPGDIDLAVFTVRAGEVTGALDDCIARGVKAAVIVSAGFKELGGSGAQLEGELVGKARAAGMVLVGPNGQGVCCPESRLYTWMPLFYPQAGNVAFICQSGNILNMLIERVLDAGFGVSKGVSSGNEADLKMEDYYEYFAGDATTHVIVSYIEGVTDGRRFLQSARRVTPRKPVIALKGGRTDSGVAAARSHTGALAVQERLFENACTQAGLTLARTIDEAGTIASSFINRPLPRGKGVGIVTGGGGLGVIAADSCVEEGLEVVPLSSETLGSIGRLLPDWWVPGNPVDLVAGLDLTIVKPILEILLHCGEVDSILLIFVEAPRSEGAVITTVQGEDFDLSAMWEMVAHQLAIYVQELHSNSCELGVPIYVVTNFDRKEAWVEESGGSGSHNMVYTTVESACIAISAMVKHYEYRRRATET